MKVLIFAGAGTSVELGVPAMKGMADEFLQHVRDWHVELETVENMFADGGDIERLLEQLDHISAARDTIAAMGSKSIDFDKLNRIRAEVEWFVQHAAERVQPSEAQLMWGPTLRATRGHRVSIVTTNYDRAVELAANAEGIPLRDGFATRSDSEYAEWTGFEGEASEMLYVKLHGSTDWYSKGKGGDPVKLKHPMPLFGRAILKLANGLELLTALILPSREKQKDGAPYPRLSQSFLGAADDCEFAVFVGASMRDAPIRQAAESILKRGPVFMINPEGSDFGVAGATALRATASAFLISILPDALISSDPIRALEERARLVQPATSIFATVKRALDREFASTIRCDAIEALALASIPLDETLMVRLLEDPTEIVARYSLGLIPNSAASQMLLRRATASSHAGVPTYAADLQLLDNLAAESA